jgi:beta-glucosidase
MMPFKKSDFPKNFFWGAASSAYQIEGHPEEKDLELSDWSKWIKREDKVLKPTNDGNAIKHFEKYEEDLKLISELGINSYRFSLNWATLHRGENIFDFKTLEFYKSLLEKLEESHIEPFATIIHFTLPEWLAKQGGWANPNTAYEFKNFTKFLLDNLGSKIKFWITLNEPNIFLNFGYESGIWPPGYDGDWKGYLEAFQGMLLGHQYAYELIKSYNSENQIGFSQNMYFYEDACKLAPIALRKILHNFSFVEVCEELNCLDFLGINYYNRLRFEFNPKAKDMSNTKLNSSFWIESKDPKSANLKTNDLGWEIYPDGLYQVLVDEKLKKIMGKKPIYITENGYAVLESLSGKDLEDSQRIDFIKTHLEACLQAIKAGINLQGYFYWSLIDNFEWALGMEPRFGLIHVDHKNFKRTKKKSFEFYRDFIR